MNKRVIVLLVLLVLAIGFYYFYTRKPLRTFSTDYSDFSITDTASIEKIFLASARGKQVLLTRVNNKWLVNEKIPADERKVNLLLQTMHDIKMRNPISEKEYNTVIKELTASGIKVEFYTKNKLLKTIYVGQETNDKVGTYMMLDGAPTPFVTHIPGFVGYMTPRFPTEAKKWKSKLIFDVAIDEIKQVGVTFPQNLDESFVIENAAQPVLKNNSGINVTASNNYLKFYLSSFVQMYGEAYDDLYTKVQQDSIAKSPAYCVIDVQRKNGEHIALYLHTKKIDQRTKERYDEKGNELEIDAEKYYGFVSGESDMIYVQQYNFGRIIKRLSEIKLMR